jgi:hypothetical protein
MVERNNEGQMNLTDYHNNFIGTLWCSRSTQSKWIEEGG